MTGVHAVPYPRPLSNEVSKRMRANHRSDTKPELALRSALHARGLRFRKDFPIRTGPRLVRPDVVFTRKRVAVFLDGCFWHACPEHGTAPQRNSAYWSQKLKQNIERDLAVNRVLAEAGWAVIRIWEHESPTEAAALIAERVSRGS